MDTLFDRPSFERCRTDLPQRRVSPALVVEHLDVVEVMWPVT
jgi:hypothetical protein